MRCSCACEPLCSSRLNADNAVKPCAVPVEVWREFALEFAQVRLAPQVANPTVIAETKVGQLDRHVCAARRYRSGGRVARVEQAEVFVRRIRHVGDPGDKSFFAEELPVTAAFLIHRNHLVVGDQRQREIVHPRHVAAEDQRASARWTKG